MFNRSRPDRDDRLKHARAWRGRGSRAEYWIVIAVAAGLHLLFPAMGATAAAAPTIFFTIRRLHDFGQTGWWAAAPFVVGVAGGLAMASSPLLAPIVQAVLLVGSVSFTAFVGLMPGDADPNRFGEPQPVFRRKATDLRQTFG